MIKLMFFPRQDLVKHTIRRKQPLTRFGGIKPSKKYRRRTLHPKKNITLKPQNKITTSKNPTKIAEKKQPERMIMIIEDKGRPSL